MWPALIEALHFLNPVMTRLLSDGRRLASDEKLGGAWDKASYNLPYKIEISLE